MTKKTLKVVISTLTLTFILSGCAKYQEAPIEIPEEPVETVVETPVEALVADEEKPEEIVEEKEDEPVSIEEEGVEISEEYVDEVVTFATYAINSLYTKNEEYTNEKRRESLKDISHSRFETHLEELNVQADEISDMVIKNIEIGDISILENFTLDSVPDLENQSAFRVNYNVDIEVDGEPENEARQMIILVQDGVLKFVNIYPIEE